MSFPTTSSVQLPVQAPALAVIEAAGVGKKYERERHRTILLKDTAKLAIGMGGGEREVF